MGSRLGEGTGICETAGSMEDAFPFWWCDNFGEFGLRGADYTRSNAPLLTDPKDFMKVMAPERLGKTGDEDYLPFDLHFLRAAIAPRAIISTDGLADTWANTFGTQITWRAADEVYRFLDAAGKNVMIMRDGPHEYQKSDWEAVISFCDQIFYGKAPNKNIQRRDPAVQDNPMAAVIPGMDWREQRLHFSWQAPEKR